MKRLRSTTVRTRAWLASLLTAAALPVAAQQSDLAVGISSSLVSRGLLLGRREPSLQANAAYYAANGLYAGISAATLRFATERDRAVQVAARAGALATLSGDWMAAAGFQHVAYPFDANWDGFGYDEATVGLAYADLAVLTVSLLRHSAEYAAAKGRNSHAIDLSGRWPLRPGLALTAGLGYHDLHARGYGYAYGHAGVGWRVGRATLDLAYTVTDSTAKEHFGAAAADHWAASVLWHF
jgi:uncharacterized protein (TIGR02001 family)